MSNRTTSVIISVVCLFSVSIALAEDRLVPSVYPTIQAAIDDCNDGDIVIVAPGTCTGDGNRDIDFLGKAITVRSEDPEDPSIVAATIIDCNGDMNNPHRGFYFHNGEDANSILAGLTITNGYSTLGGGIFCDIQTHPIITNCIISDNSAEFGGGIGSDAGAPTITECDIINNTAGSGGGLIGCNGPISNCTIVGNHAVVGGGLGGGFGAITNCIISNNSASQEGGAMAGCQGPVTNCIIAGNTTEQYGGGLHYTGGPITNCTIVGNSAEQYGGGLNHHGAPIKNCIIWNNTAAVNPQLAYSSEPNYSCIQDWIGGGIGNISTDPCFVDAGYWDTNGTPADPNDDFWVEGDYHLSSPSLCINAGDPCFLPEPNETDIDGEPRIIYGRVDIGADEFHISVVYVPDDYPTIQAAINAVYDGDTVIVAPGTYTGPGNRDIDFLGKAITVRSTDPNDPNIVAATIIDCNGTESDPHRGFYFHSQEDSNSILDGLTITNGWSSYRGGGIYCEADFFQSNTPIIRNCIIKGNTADSGGGIGCNSRSSPIINNCTISENLATDGFGGGIYHGSYVDKGKITNCTITNNWASEHGGGAYHCATSINNSRIIGNSAGGDGGGLRACSEVNNCIISGNTAAEWGGGLHFCMSVVNCIITGNSAKCGGGVSCTENISNSTIACNRAKEKGGAVFSETGGGSINECILENSILWGNTAPLGPEIYLPTMWASIASPPYTVEIPSKMTVAYSDIQAGQTGIHVDPNSTLIWNLGNIDADPCFIDPGFWDPNGTPADPNDDFWVDGDYHLKSGGWRLDALRQLWTWDDVTSRCIDAGNPGSTLCDEPLSVPEDPNNMWGHNLRINMGAFGGTAEASIPPYDWALLADLTNNGIVDLADFAYQVADWLDSADQQPGDLNRDGIIDVNDLALLIEDWLAQTTWH